MSNNPIMLDHSVVQGGGEHADAAAAAEQQRGHKSTTPASAAAARVAQDDNSESSSPHHYDADDEDASSCRPPSGSTYLTIGHDLFSIGGYMTSMYNASLHAGSTTPMSSFAPAAVMTYTDIASLNGTDSPVDYGSGVEYADGVLDSLFPSQSVGLQIGLWLFGAEGCLKIVEGGMDEEIRRLVHYLDGCGASRIFLRVGYEFDNPDFKYSTDPQMYARAFRVIVDAWRRHEDKHGQQRHEHRPGRSSPSKKVLFVWHSWGAPMAEGVELGDFYPGDNYVDWIGVSIFQQVYGSPSDLRYVERVMEFAQTHRKPTMIAESTPFGGINRYKQRDVGSSASPQHGDDNHNGSSSDTKASLVVDDDPWNYWFGKVLTLIIDRYDVSMWSYINCDWESQPMWNGVGFGDTRISSNPDILRRWLHLVYHDDTQSGGGATAMTTTRRRFLVAGSLDDCGCSSSDAAAGGAADDAAPRSLLKSNANHYFADVLSSSRHTMMGLLLLIGGIAAMSVFFVRGDSRASRSTSCKKMHKEQNDAPGEDTPLLLVPGRNR